jgi:monothiol glutaredoxin
MLSISRALLILVATSWTACSFSFNPLAVSVGQRSLSRSALVGSSFTKKLHQSTGDDFLEELAGDVQEKIQALVDAHPVLLFMKGSKLFPQCGFSNNAVQILNSFGVTFHAIDVLADQSIREGIKVFSQWPTIPQLYIQGEFIGGSDIMIEMYQSGELGEMLEKVKADQV